jgi:hypothetical protein
LGGEVVFAGEGEGAEAEAPGAGLAETDAMAVAPLASSSSGSRSSPDSLTDAAEDETEDNDEAEDEEEDDDEDEDGAGAGAVAGAEAASFRAFTTRVASLMSKLTFCVLLFFGLVGRNGTEGGRIGKYFIDNDSVAVTLGLFQKRANSGVFGFIRNQKNEPTGHNVILFVVVLFPSEFKENKR